MKLFIRLERRAPLSFIATGVRKVSASIYFIQRLERMLGFFVLFPRRVHDEMFEEQKQLRAFTSQVTAVEITY
jgi:hypothetical protein